jgi:hypothetical protein
MARSLHLRRWWWVVASVAGIGLVAWYVWWSTRLSRAVDRVLTMESALQQASAWASATERIPDAWVPDLTWEVVRDDTEIEAMRVWVQSRIPSKLIPPSIRYPGADLRRNRGWVALAAGRDENEVLRALALAYPKAPPNGAQFLVTLYEAISAREDSGRRSLFLTASRNPDPQVRLASVALVAGNLNTGKNGDRSDGPAWDRLRELLDDQVSVVREAATKALAEAGDR